MDNCRFGADVMRPVVSRLGGIRPEHAGRVLAAGECIETRVRPPGFDTPLRLPPGRLAAPAAQLLNRRRFFPPEALHDRSDRES